MKRGRLRQSLAFLAIGLVMFAFVNVSWVAADGVEVEVPYAVTNAQWWTGVAIKNLDASKRTGTVGIEFFDQEGVFMRTVDIGSIEPQEIYSEMTSTLYRGSLPLMYSIIISHPGNQELAATVFVGNSATGGFAYQTYNSQATAVHSWDQILPANERFELVMNDEAVLDRETGLVWQRDTSNRTYTWYDAQSFCYIANIGGRKGWRPPTIEELATLVDPFKLDPSLPTGHPFTNPKFTSYWSSTTRADNTDHAWRVHFCEGSVSYGGKSSSCYFRAVRSGQ